MQRGTIPSNKLQSSWTFYWKMNKARQARHRKHTTSEYKNTLNRLGTVETLHDFWRQYSCLEAPSNLPCGDIYMMRGATEPMWENFPGGAAWIMCVDATKHPLARNVPRGNGGCETYIPCVNGLWEEILSAAVRERFGTENLVCVNISVRRNHFKILLWLGNVGSQPDTHLPNRLMELCRIPQDVQLHYKTFFRALNDRSTTLRAQKFTYEKLEHAEPAMLSMTSNKLPTIMEDEAPAKAKVPTTDYTISKGQTGKPIASASADTVSSLGQRRLAMMEV